jgi:hypothetical protein
MQGCQVSGDEGLADAVLKVKTASAWTTTSYNTQSVLIKKS